MRFIVDECTGSSVAEFLKQNNHEIILIRCTPNNFQTRIEVLSKLLDNYSQKIDNNFIVVTNTKVRIIS
jgi:hypothetical protein